VGFGEEARNGLCAVSFDTPVQGVDCASKLKTQSKEARPREPTLKYLVTFEAINIFCKPDVFNVEMDPLSITISVITLTTKCTATAIDIYNAYQCLCAAPDTISDLIEGTAVVRGSLRQIEKVLKSNPDSLSKSELSETFDIAVKGCRATLVCLEEEFGNLTGRSDWKAKVKIVWKEPKMRSLLNRLERKKSSLSILLHCLHMYVPSSHVLVMS
jgi:hypothetical protein